jgi:multicomponent Na+:H+ antiporter subunit G
MIELARDALSWVLLLAGGFFLIVGAIGLNRMPDVYSRLQATGVSDTVGAGFILLGLVFQAGFTLVAVKLVFLILIFVFTAPVATHAVTRAALSAGIEPKLFDERGRKRQQVTEEVSRARTAARPGRVGSKGKGKTSAGRQGGRSSKH